MGVAAGDIKLRLRHLRDYFNERSRMFTEPELVPGTPMEKDLEKFVALVHKQPYYPDYAEIDQVNPIERSLTHLFSKYRDFSRSLESIYKSLIKTAEKRFNFKFDLSSTSQLSSDLRGLTVADWFGDLIRNKPKNFYKLEKLEDIFRTLRQNLGLHLPFSKGAISESRTELALAAIEMEQKLPIKVDIRPSHKSEKSLEQYIQTSMGLLNGLIRRIKKKQIEFKKPPSLEELQNQLPEEDPSKKRDISTEQMGIDFLIKVEDGVANRTCYLPLQVKSTQVSATNFQNNGTIFAFDYESLDELKTKVTDPIVCNSRSPKIRFRRNIPCIAAGDKTITDLKSELEAIIQGNQKLKLKTPYHHKPEEGGISNVDLIAAMINQGFLTAVEEVND